MAERQTTVRNRAASVGDPDRGGEQLDHVGGVGGVGAGEAGGAYAGRTAERRHLETGVVGEGGDPGDGRHGARLELGVALQGRLGLGDVGPVEPRHDPHRRRQLDQDRLDLGQLVRVVRGDHQPVDGEPGRGLVAHGGGCGPGPSLEVDQRVDPGGGEVEHLVQLGPAERRSLGGSLDLDQPTRPRHHHVAVDLGGDVLLVGEVEQDLVADHPHRDGGDVRPTGGTPASRPDATRAA